MDAKKAHELVEELDLADGRVTETLHGIVEALTGEKYQKDDGIIPLFQTSLYRRESGCWGGKALCLPNNADWRILIDDEGILCLVRFKKGKAPRRSDV